MRGIDKFKERFAGHDGEYVLIGGGACDLPVSYTHLDVYKRQLASGTSSNTSW